MKPPITIKDSDLLPLSSAFQSGPSLAIRDGRKTFRDENGTWHNALGDVSTDAHSHVTKRWQDRCISLPDFIAQLEESGRDKSDKIIDIQYLHLKDDLTVHGGRRFTEFGFKSLLSFTGVGMPMAEFLITRGYQPDLAKYVNRELDRRAAQIRGGDKMLVRMRTDSAGNKVIRAVLSQDYRKFDNVEFARALLDAMPKGTASDTLVSHAWSDDDDFNATFLLPDCVKSRPDSDYGIGINGGNSEIGRRASTAYSELFRAVSWTGNKWGLNRKECVLRKIHAGAVSKEELRTMIKDLLNIARAEGDLLLAVLDNARTVKVVNPRQTIAYLSRNQNLTQEQGQAWWEGYMEGLAEPHGDQNDRTVAGIYFGLTRAAQKYDGFTRMQIEGVASIILAPGLRAGLTNIEDRWTTYSKSGAMLNEKVVAQYTGPK